MGLVGVELINAVDPLNNVGLGDEEVTLVKTNYFTK
jgi:hypothetical protein